MKFNKINQKNKVEVLGKRVGYIFGYFLFTTILFFMLRLLNKIPYKWNYLHIMGITLTITLIGIGIKKLLK